MSKKSPPGRPLPPPQPIPPDNPAGDNPPPGDPPAPPLTIELFNLDEIVLAQSNVGEIVTILKGQNLVTVTTLTGIRLGDVKQTDAVELQQKQTMVGNISSIGVNPARCSVVVF